MTVIAVKRHNLYYWITGGALVGLTISLVTELGNWDIGTFFGGLVGGALFGYTIAKWINYRPMGISVSPPVSLRREEVTSHIGKCTAEQLAKEREARAAREEMFRRICDEAEATQSTFEQAAHRLGLSRHIVDYFEADRENVKAAWEKINKSNPAGARRTESKLNMAVATVKAFFRRNSVIVVRSIAVLVLLGLLVLLAIFFRYDIRTVDKAGFVIIRHDRWTGNTERCIVTRGCFQY